MTTLEELFLLVKKNHEETLRTNADLLAEIKMRDIKVKEMEVKVETLMKDVKNLKGAVNDREQYARGWSVRVFGLNVSEDDEKKFGKDKAVMKKAYDRLIKPILNEAKLKGEIETVPAWYNVLENGHKLRQSKKAKETNPKAPPPIIIRFSSKYMRSTVLRNKKKSTPTPTLAEVTETGVKVFRIAEDLTAHNFFLLRSMWDDARVENAWTIDGRIRYTKAGETDVIYPRPGYYTSVDEILQPQE